MGGNFTDYACSKTLWRAKLANNIKESHRRPQAWARGGHFPFPRGNEKKVVNFLREKVHPSQRKILATPMNLPTLKKNHAGAHEKSQEQ